MRKRKLAILLILVMPCAVAVAAVGALPDGVPEHPALAEVVAMAEAGVADVVILKRLDQIQSVPELDGHALAALRSAGVTDRVLLQLVEMAGTAVSPPLAEPPQPQAPPPQPMTSTPPAARPDTSTPPRKPPEPATVVQPVAASDPPPMAAAPVSGGRVVVAVERSFPIHYLEVVLDGKRVLEEGQLYLGKSEDGQFLRRPAPLDEPEDGVVFVGWVVPGEHTVSVGFAATEVVSDPEDEWHEASAEEYVTGGVLVNPSGVDNETVTQAETIHCRVEPSDICRVQMKLERTVGRGGVIEYSAIVTAS